MRSSILVRVVLSLCLPGLLIEAIARTVGWSVHILRPRSALTAESRVRAAILNLRYGYAAKRIGRAVVIDDPGRVRLGKGVSLHTGVVITVGARGWCHIAEGSHISHYSVLAASGGVNIGPKCAISSGVIIYSVTYGSAPKGGTAVDGGAAFAAVTLKGSNHVGAGARILPGVTVGFASIIGAGAVVTKTVEARTKVAGVPARPLAVEPDTSPS